MKGICGILLLPQKNIDLNIDLTKNKQNSLKESWQQEVFREVTPFEQVFRPAPSYALGGPGRYPRCPPAVQANKQNLTIF